MQYAVPQFTDVEDKLVAGLGFKQFGILLGVGVLIFFAWQLTHSILFVIFIAVFVGIPALVVILLPFNGRPLYKSIIPLAISYFAPKHYIFYKQGQMASENKEPVTIQETKTTVTSAAALVRIKELNYLLQQQATEENILIERLAESAQAKQQTPGVRS